LEGDLGPTGTATILAVRLHSDVNDVPRDEFTTGPRYQDGLQGIDMMSLNLLLVVFVTGPSMKVPYLQVIRSLFPVDF
jgi:hypothetical protein